MKKKEKLVILVLLIITIALVVVGIQTKTKNDGTKISDNSSQTSDKESGNEEETEDKYVVYLDDGTRVNSSDKVTKDRTINGLKLSNLQLTEKDNMTKLLVNVKNTTNDTKLDVVYNLTLVDSKGEELTVLSIYIPEIKAGETKQGFTSVSGDYANAYDLKIEG